LTSCFAGRICTKKEESHSSRIGTTFDRSFFWSFEMEFTNTISSVEQKDVKKDLPIKNVNLLQKNELKEPPTSPTTTASTTITPLPKLQHSIDPCNRRRVSERKSMLLQTKPGLGCKYYADIKFHDVRKTLTNLGYTLCRSPKTNLNQLSILWRNYRNIPFRDIELLVVSNRRETDEIEEKKLSPSSSTTPMFMTPILNHLEHSYLLTRKAELFFRMKKLIETSNAPSSQWLSKRIPLTYVLHATREDPNQMFYEPNRTDLSNVENLYLVEVAKCISSRGSTRKSADGGDGIDDDIIHKAKNVVNGVSEPSILRSLCLHRTMHEILPQQDTNQSSSSTYTPATSDGNDNIWIIKPSTLSRGRGIKMVGTLHDLLNEIECICNEKPNIKSMKLDINIIIQKYLDTPLLLPMMTKESNGPTKGKEKEIKKCKFDIRCWVAVTYTNQLSIHVFKQPYLRLCGK
jgi:hypothetical protein